MNSIFQDGGTEKRKLKLRMLPPAPPHLLEKVVPILVLQVENDTLFCGKTKTFQHKTTPLSR